MRGVYGTQIVGKYKEYIHEKEYWKMRLASSVSIPASCFFDRHADAIPKRKGTFFNPECKLFRTCSWISQLRFEHLKTVTVYFWTLQGPSDPVFLNLSRVSCMFGRDDIMRVTFMLAGGRYVNSQLVPSEKSPLAYTSPKLKVSTPCPKMRSCKLKSIVWVHMKYMYSMMLMKIKNYMIEEFQCEFVSSRLCLCRSGPCFPPAVEKTTLLSLWTFAPTKQW